MAAGGLRADARAGAVGDRPDRDPVQTYCDILEHKWLLSERSRRDIGLEEAIRSYLAIGAPAPEDPSGAPVLDVDDDEEADDRERDTEDEPLPSPGRQAIRRRRARARASRAAPPGARSARGGAAPTN